MGYTSLLFTFTFTSSIPEISGKFCEDYTRDSEIGVKSRTERHGTNLRGKHVFLIAAVISKTFSQKLPLVSSTQQIQICSPLSPFNGHFIFQVDLR